MNNNHFEDDHQKALFQFAAYVKALKWFHAIPNGGKRNLREAVRLKAQGTKAGVHDTFLPKARGVYHGCYLEMKHGKNRLSEKQIEFALEVIAEGYCSFTCYSSAEAEEALKLYLKLEQHETISSTFPHLSMNHKSS